MDFSDLFKKREPKEISEESKEYIAFKAMFTPCWSEVIDFGACINHFMSMGTTFGKHIMTCNDPECNLNFGPASFCDPSLFLRILINRFDDYKDFPESTDLKQLWTSRELDRVALDPRYIAFRSAFDLQVIQLFAFRQSLHDPYRSLKFE